MSIFINYIRINIYIVFFQFTSPKAIRNTTPPLARHNTSPCVTFTVGLSLVLWPWGVKYNDKTNHRGYTALRQTARCKTNISEVTFSTLLLGALLKYKIKNSFLVCMTGNGGCKERPNKGFVDLWITLLMYSLKGLPQEIRFVVKVSYQFISMYN